jgi:hypothetical protein
MNKQHYEAIAKILRMWVTHDVSKELNEADHVVEDLTDYFSHDNPRFNKEKFEQAVYG